jgi:hypothetical protein
MNRNNKDTTAMCTICLEPVDNNNNRFVLECSHEFHKKCIAEWFKNDLILNKDGYIKTIVIQPTDHGFIVPTTFGICDGCEVSCPVCRKHYSYAQKDNVVCFDVDESIMIPDSYIVKIKYACDAEKDGLDNLWFTQYIFDLAEIQDLLYPSLVVESKKKKLFDKHNKYASKKIVEYINRELAYAKNENIKLTFHALHCDCKNEFCMGYLFVPENKCFLCNNNVVHMGNHYSHITPKELENFLVKKGKDFCDKNGLKVFDENDIDSDTDSDSNNAESDNSDDESENGTDSEKLCDDHKYIEHLNEHIRELQKEIIRVEEENKTTQIIPPIQNIRGGANRGRGRGRGAGRGQGRGNVRGRGRGHGRGGL